MNNVDGEDNHFIKEAITTVLDFKKPLEIEYKNIISSVHPGLLTLQPDQHGNNTVAIPLTTEICLYLRDIYYIDENFIRQMEGTTLYDLVWDKYGCYAISALEVLEK